MNVTNKQLNTMKEQGLFSCYYILTAVGNERDLQTQAKNNLKDLLDTFSYNRPFFSQEDAEYELSGLMMEMKKMVEEEISNCDCGGGSLYEAVKEDCANFAILDMTFTQNKEEVNGKKRLDNTPISGVIYKYVKSYLDKYDDVLFSVEIGKHIF